MTASHLVLIPFVTLVLMFQRDAVLSSVARRRGAGLSVMLAGGFGFALASRLYRPTGVHDDSLSLVLGAFVVLWIGGFVVAYGTDRVARRAVSALLFLAFTIPIPGSLLNGASSCSRRGRAKRSS